MLAADVVTADGGVRARERRRESRPLSWGLRGGGGNFGIVTEFEFRLPIRSGRWWSPGRSSGRWRSRRTCGCASTRDWIADAPDELMTIVIHRKAPAVPFVPAELHGQLIVGVACCYAGSVEEGEKVVHTAQGISARRCSTSASRSPTSRIRRCSTPRFRTDGGTTFRACDVATLTDEVIDMHPWSTRCRSAHR